MKHKQKSNPKQPILDDQDAELLETGKFYDAQGNRYMPPDEGLNQSLSKKELVSMTKTWLAQVKKESKITKNPK